MEGRKVRDVKVVPFAPDLAVEILSESNTPREMERKLQEYFAAGTRLVWYVDPEKRTARVYTSERDFADLSENDDLDGRDVLPGFTIRLGTLFDDVEGPGS
jgi:Uma2 family endonuclease